MKKHVFKVIGTALVVSTLLSGCGNDSQSIGNVSQVSTNENFSSPEEAYVEYVKPAMDIILEEFDNVSADFWIKGTESYLDTGDVDKFINSMENHTEAYEMLNEIVNNTNFDSLGEHALLAESFLADLSQSIEYRQAASMAISLALSNGDDEDEAISVSSTMADLSNEYMNSALDSYIDLGDEMK